MYVYILCRSKLNGRIYFAGRFFRVFDRGQNNCYFDSAVKNTNMQHVFFTAPFSFDLHNICAYVRVYIYKDVCVYIYIICIHMCVYVCMCVYI